MVDVLLLRCRCEKLEHRVGEEAVHGFRDAESPRLGLDEVEALSAEAISWRGHSAGHGRLQVGHRTFARNEPCLTDVKDLGGLFDELEGRVSTIH